MVGSRVRVTAAARDALDQETFEDRVKSRLNQQRGEPGG